jgi:putative endonuclease
VLRPEVVAMLAKDAVGQYGEGLAERFLIDAGLTILERNWRCSLGEVDIVARDGDSLVICEVKTRTGTGFGTPLEAVTPLKVRRLRQLAGAWLAAHDIRPGHVRIDVVGIVVPRRGAPVVEHLRSVG